MFAQMVLCSRNPNVEDVLCFRSSIYYILYIMFASPKNKDLNCQQARVPALGMSFFPLELLRDVPDVSPFSQLNSWNVYIKANITTNANNEQIVKTCRPSWTSHSDCCLRSCTTCSPWLLSVLLHFHAFQAAQCYHLLQLPHFRVLCLGNAGALGTPVLFKKLLIKAWLRKLLSCQNPKVSLLDQPGDVPTSLVEDFVHDFSKMRVVRV